jgi:hypothetical protein
MPIGNANVINTFHEDNFTVGFSNFPKVFSIDNVQQVDLRMFEYFVKNVVIPDSSLETMDIDFRNAKQLSPISPANNDLPQLTIEFKADETLRNYFYFFSFIKRTRYGTIEVDKFRDNVIKEIYVNALDNQGRIISRISFMKALPVSCGSLTLSVGQSNELSFSVSFAYEEFKITMYDSNGNEVYYDSDS